MPVIRPPPEGPDGAFIDCPCIDHDNRSGEAFSSQYYGIIQASPYLQDGSLVTTTMRRLPRNYGSAICKAWDADGVALPECEILGGGPEYCGLKWCYVDPRNCHPRRSPARSSYFRGLALYYSYTTCGNLHLFTTGPTYWLGMAPVLVHAFGQEVSSRPVGRTSPWRAMASFTYQVLIHMQIPAAVIKYTELSQTSRELYQSEYTSCIHDLVLGHLDICVGDFWDTPQRRQMKATFSSTVYSEAAYMYTKMRPDRGTLVDRLRQPLRPFTTGLWMLLFFVMVAAGFAMLALERGTAGNDFEGFGPAHTIIECLFVSASSFMNAGVLFGPKTGSGKIFATMLAFFICVTMASFTANTASFLLYEAKVSDLDDLDHALRLGLKVCILEAMEDQLKQAYPGLQELGVVLPRAPDSFPALARGDCEAAITTEPFAAEVHSTGAYCEYQAVGEALAHFPTSVVVSHRLQGAFDASLVERRTDGTWRNLVTMIYPGSACEDDGEERWEQAQQLRPEHMLGNCGLLLLCFVLSLALKFCKRVGHTAPMVEVEEVVADVISDVRRDLTSGVGQLEGRISEVVQFPFTPHGSPPGSPRLTRRAGQSRGSTSAASVASGSSTGGVSVPTTASAPREREPMGLPEVRGPPRRLHVLLSL